MSGKEQAILEAAREFVAAQKKFYKVFAKTVAFGNAQKKLHEAREKLIAAVEAE